VPFATILEATRPNRAAALVPAGEFTDARVRLHAFYRFDPGRLVERRDRLGAYALAGILFILLLGIAARQWNERLFPPRPAVLEFEVKPRGDVVIDGRSYGRTPPLREVEIPPGRHRVRVMNGNYPTLELSMKVEPGERVLIAHTFTGDRPAARPGGFWRDLRRSLGF
jgi:hypothetical protein